MFGTGYESARIHGGAGSRFVVQFSLALAILALFVMPAPARAQQQTWACSPDGLLFQLPSTIYDVELVTGEATVRATDYHEQDLNAVGYNVLDNYVYGFGTGPTPSETDGIVRVGGDASTTVLGVPAGVTPRNYHIGDIDENGHYWVTGGDVWYQVDLDSSSPTYFEVLSSGSKEGVGLADWSYVPNGANSLYFVAYNNGTSHDLYRFDRGTKQFHNLGSLGILGDGGDFGATYADSEGFLYASQNSTGQIFRIDVDNVSATLFANGPSTSNNDGARCFTAPVLVDFGDAPANYGTLLADDGPRHGIRFYDAGDNTAPLMLGTTVDPEDDGQPTAAADGDGSDEDGVADPITIIAGQPTQVTVTATNDTAEVATLAGWIDLDGSGAFDAGERVVETVPANTGDADYTLSFPAGSLSTDTLARFRLLPGNVAEPSPTGVEGAGAGEVEDYPVLAGLVHYEKTVSPDDWAALDAGEDLTYTVTVTNEGGVDLVGLSFVDDLSGVLDDAAYNNDVAATTGAAAFNGPDEIAWSGDLAVGEFATITYSVTIGSPPGGDAIAVNTIVGEGPGSNCEAGSTDPACFKQVPQAQVSSVKTLLGPSDPAVGDTVSYSFTVTNTGPVEATNAVVYDDLAGVLDDATYNGNATATNGTVEYDASGGRLVWNGPLAEGGSPGDSVTVEYSVTVNGAEDLGDGVLNNALLSTGCPNPPVFDPGAPGYDPNCVTSSPIEAWTSTKTSNRASGAIRPGGVLTYTVVIENTGGADLTGLSISDDLGEVLDDAAYNDDVGADVGTASYSAPTVAWDGDLAVGQVARVTYSVTVNESELLGDGELVNAVVGAPNCPPPVITDPDAPGFNPDCATIHQAEAWEAVKSSDASGAISVGSVVSYRITVTNTGNVDLVAGDGGALQVLDDLSRVLDDATYNDDVSASIGAASFDTSLNWDGNLRSGESAVITYSVTVDTEAAGDGVLTNALVGTPNCPDPAITDPEDPAFVSDCVTVSRVIGAAYMPVPMDSRWMLVLLALVLVGVARGARAPRVFKALR